MVLPVIANVYRVALNWRDLDGSQTAENVIHVLGSTPDDPTAVRDIMQTEIQDNMLLSVAGQWKAETVSITPLDGTSATAELPLDNWSGQAATGDYTPQEAAIVKLGTGFRGRSHRGRIFLPGTAESKSQNGFLTGTTPGDMTVAWATFQGNLEANVPSFQLVVASYKLRTALPVLSLLVENAVATQRRRQQRNR